MNAFGCVVTLTMLLAIAEADRLRPSEVDRSSPNHCVWTEARTNSRTLHPVGSSWNAGGCKKIACIEKDGTLYLETTGCGLDDILPPCTVQQSSYPDGPYPACCPKAFCP